MANEEHLAILRQGVEVWNKWREENPEAKPDLRGADLRAESLAQADLRRADLARAWFANGSFYQAKFNNANLRHAMLNGADLSWVNMSGAQLYDVGLLGADLSRTNLSGADLSWANLASATLEATQLYGACLKEATISSTIFADLDLSGVIGLDAVRHTGPSTIGIDTLIRSGGNIPQSFLRGCGVPDAWIAHLPSLIGALEPIQFYSCFISYSSKDEGFAHRLHSRMRDHNLRVWFADEDMKGGAKLHEQIDQAIRIHDKLVLVLSEQSIQSEWVMTEIRKARKAELRDQRRKLFPIRLVDMDTLRDWECFDADTGKDLAVEVREYFIPDFTQWKDHDSFEGAFARFLKDLQAVEAPPVPRQAAKVSDEAKSSKVGTSESIIEIKKRRLRLLEAQQARKGHDAEPHIVMEIEDLRREIAGLEDAR